MMIVSRAGRAAGTAAMLLVLSGCAQAMGAAPGEQVRGLRGADAHVVLRSGEKMVLRSPFVEGDSVYGGWVPGPAGDERVAVALADIAQVYDASPTLVERQIGPVGGGWGLALAAAALGVALVLLNGVDAP
jgi:hypothetical protein